MICSFLNKLPLYKTPKDKLMQEQTIIQDLNPTLRDSSTRPNNRSLKSAILHMYKNSNRRNSISQNSTLTQSKAAWTCTLCHVECSLDQLEPIGTCQHVYCVTCAKAYIQYRIRARESIRCPEEVCAAQVNRDSPHFQELPAEMRQRYQQFWEFERSKGNPSLFLCKRHECSSIVSYGPGKEAVACPDCHALYCARCLYFKHTGPCTYFDKFFFQEVENPLHPSQVQLPSRIVNLFEKAQQEAARSQQEVARGPPVPMPPPYLAAHGGPLRVPPPPPPLISQSQVVSGRPLVIPLPDPIPPPGLINALNNPAHSLHPPPPIRNNNLPPPASFTIGDSPPSILAIQTQQHLAPTNRSRVIPLPPNATDSMRHPPTFARNPPPRQSHKKCTWKEVVLWCLLPFTIIGVALAMLFALIAEVIMAMVKGAGNFIGQNLSKAKSTWCKVLLYITIPFQAIIGMFLAPYFLRNDPTYKFGEYTKVVWHYAQKALPHKLRHCCGSSASSTARTS